MLYLLYPSVIEFIFFIVNKQTTSIPRTFEKLATPLDTVTQVTEFHVARPEPCLNPWPVGRPAVFGFLSNRHKFVLSYE